VKKGYNFIDYSNSPAIKVLKNSIPILIWADTRFRLSIDTSNGSNYSDYTFNSFDTYNPPFNFKRLNLDLNWRYYFRIYYDYETNTNEIKISKNYSTTLNKEEFKITAWLNLTNQTSLNVSCLVKSPLKTTILPNYLTTSEKKDSQAEIQISPTKSQNYVSKTLTLADIINQINISSGKDTLIATNNEMSNQTSNTEIMTTALTSTDIINQINTTAENMMTFSTFISNLSNQHSSGIQTTSVGKEVSKQTINTEIVNTTSTYYSKIKEFKSLPLSEIINLIFSNQNLNQINISNLIDYLENKTFHQIIHHQLMNLILNVIVNQIYFMAKDVNQK